MRLVCPLCHAAYNIDERRLPPGGANVRCPKCRGVFPLVPSAPAAQAEPVPAPPFVPQAAPAAPQARAVITPPPPVIAPPAPVIPSPPAAVAVKEPPSPLVVPPPRSEDWLDFGGLNDPFDAPSPSAPPATEPLPPSSPTATSSADRAGLSFGEVDFDAPAAPPPSGTIEAPAPTPSSAEPDELLLGDTEPFPFESPAESPSTSAPPSAVPQPSTSPVPASPDEPTAFGEHLFDQPGATAPPPHGDEPAWGERSLEPERAAASHVEPPSAPASTLRPTATLDEPAPLPARREPPPLPRGAAAAGQPAAAEPPIDDGLEALFGAAVDASAAGTATRAFDGTAATRQLEPTAATRQLEPPVATAVVPPPELERTAAVPSEGGATRWWRRKLVLVPAAVVLVLAGVGGAAAWTPWGAFFHRALRGQLGATRPGARFLLEARQRLAEDRFSSVKSAVELADRALALDARDPEAQAVYTYAASLLARRHGAGAAAWTRARSFLPELGKRAASDVDAAKAVVGAALVTGDGPPAAALATVEKAAAKQGSTDGDAFLVLGDAALVRGDAAQAASWYRRLEPIEPGSVRANHGLGVSAALRGDTAAARRHLDAALGRDPQHVTTAVALASLALTTGEPERAEALAREVLADGQSQTGPRQRARARAVMGQLLTRAVDDHVEASLAAAERELTAASQEDADDVEARLALGQFLLDRGELDRAAAALTPIPVGLRDPRVVSLQARIADGQGKSADAMALLDAALQKLPGDGRLLYTKGTLSSGAGKQGDADRFWNEAVQREPLAYEPHLALAQARLARGDLEGADRELKLATERAPANAAVRSTAADLLVARHELGPAEAGYDAALAVDRSHGPAYLGLARVALEWRDVPAARTYLRRAVTITPRLQPAQALYGELLWRAGDLPQAAKAFERAVALDPRDATSLARLGAIELEQGDHEGAVKHLRTAVDLTVPTAEVRAWYGRALFAKGEPQASIEQLKKSIELDPKVALVHLDLGRAHERVGNGAEAVQEYRAAQQLAPQLGEAFEALGVLYAGQNRCQEALPQLEKAATLSRNGNRIRVVLADCKAKVGKQAEAVALYRRVLQADPRQVGLYYKIARAQHEATGIREAMVWYEQAAREEPTNPMSHYYMGFAHKERGRATKAIEEFRAYLRISPNALDRKDIEREIEDLGGAAAAERP